MIRVSQATNILTNNIGFRFLQINASAEGVELSQIVEIGPNCVDYAHDKLLPNLKGSDLELAIDSHPVQFLVHLWSLLKPNASHVRSHEIIAGFHE
ncbi:hypothetical protein PanWU01x14_352670 [Parasponia andersonii]|uniref:Uncharacterized protein n=1 Tax=Parasponia andersonii TaxID=3476 RepID=A0A2P5AA89_PARAD|nr:hypothetical protein PanWU01x14_352670 [Parasponia andersonii]